MDTRSEKTMQAYAYGAHSQELIAAAAEARREGDWVLLKILTAELGRRGLSRE